MVEPVTPDRYRATYTDPSGRVSTYEATASADHDVLAGYWCDVNGLRGQFTMEKIASDQAGVSRRAPQAQSS